MFGQEHEHGRDWTPAAGAVAESRRHGRNWSYVVDFRRATGEAVRITVPAFDGHDVELAPGTPVRIEVDATSGQGRLTAPPAPVAPTTFSSPDPSVGQPGLSPGPAGSTAPATTFSSPTPPSSFSPGGSLRSGIAGGSFGSGSFGPGSFGGSGTTKADRLAGLEDQRDRGQLTPEQFAAQRQQIQDEI